MATRQRGLTVQTFQGLSKKRMASKGLGSGLRLIFANDKPTQTVQFLQPPDDFVEFQQHQFKEDGRWTFVPCAGKEECPLCDNEDEAVRKLSYRFACNVYNLSTSKVQVLEGPKTLATLIYYRFERKPSVFLKRVFDITKFPTTPVSYHFELAEEKATSTVGKKAHDLDEYLAGELKRYYGDDLDLVAADLRADDDEDEAPSRKKRPVAVADDDADDEDDDDFADDDVDDDDEDDDDFDDDDDDADDDDADDDDEDEEEEPEPPKRTRAKKTAGSTTRRR